MEGLIGDAGSGAYRADDVRRVSHFQAEHQRPYLRSLGRSAGVALDGENWEQELDECR